MRRVGGWPFTWPGSAAGLSACGGFVCRVGRRFLAMKCLALGRETLSCAKSAGPGRTWSRRAGARCWPAREGLRPGGRPPSRCRGAGGLRSGELLAWAGGGKSLVGGLGALWPASLRCAVRRSTSPRTVTGEALRDGQWKLCVGLLHICKK